MAELARHFQIVDGFGWGRFSALLTLICGVPGLGSLVLPAYRWLARREISTVSESGYWQGSTVIARCRPKGTASS